MTGAEATELLAAVVESLAGTEPAVDRAVAGDGGGRIVFDPVQVGAALGSRSTPVAWWDGHGDWEVRTLSGADRTVSAQQAPAEIAAALRVALAPDGPEECNDDSA